MSIFTKKINEIPVTENKEVDGAEVWMVSWNSLRNRGFRDATLVNDVRVAKAFLKQEDAYEFKEALEKAMNLLQCTFRIDIRVEKQE